MGCESCDSCMASCEHSFQKMSDIQGKFYFRDYGKSLKTNESFLTAKEWNSLITYIIEGYEKTGNTTTAASYKYNDKTIFAKGNSESNYYPGLEGQTIMTANMYNGALAKMKYLAEDKINTTVAQGAQITATYFNNLVDYANKYFGLKNGTTGNYCAKCLGSDEATYCCDESSGGGDSCDCQYGWCESCDSTQCDCQTIAECAQS